LTFLTGGYTSRKEMGIVTSREYNVKL